MVGFADALESSLRASLCSWLADTNANVRGWTERAFGAPLPNPITSGWQALLCDLPPAPPSPPPPFTGGQCGELYDIVITSSWERRNCDGSLINTVGPTTQTISAQPGPIVYLGVTQLEYAACGGTQLSAKRESVRNSGPGQNVFSGGPTAAPPGGYLSNVQVSFSTVYVGPGSDDCGDPPPASQPPTSPDGGWVLPPVVIVYDNSQGGQTTVEGDTTIYAPVVNFDGSVFAPVNIRGNDLDLDLNVRIGGPGGFGIDLGQRRPPGSDTSTDVPPPAQPPDIAPPGPGDDDTERRVIGVVVTTTDVANSGSTTILQEGGNPNVYVPDLGLISFSVSAGNDGFGWTPDIRVKNTKSYIPCPAPQGALSVKGTPRPGVTWTVTPVFGGRDRAFTEPQP